MDTATAPEPLGRTMADLRCLVIGAASGIGAATAARLHGRVGSVIGADLAQPNGTRFDAHFPTVTIDVADPQSVQHAVRETLALTGGGLDVVVNTAGILGRIQPSTEESVADFERLLRINLVGAFLVSTAVLPMMAAQRFGRLVHFSSTAGKEGVAGMTGYSASKAGVIGLVKALAKEYAATGVTVNAIAPGKISTPLISAQPPTRKDLQRIPMGRIGTVEEAASLVEYVISPVASYTTGFVYDLSGGRANY
jgi:3-oxoacyl-[acyl-carrier protein] reductase